MLRQFQYYDQNGKDQGINVRNRAKELADLLSDVDRIRAERKKARSNRNKFGGVEGGAGFSGAIGSGAGGSSRYGGFGSEDASFGGYTGAVYGDGGGFGGNTSSFNDNGRRDKFEEYDEGDDPADPPATSRHTTAAPPSSSLAKQKYEPKVKEPELEIDLFEFGDEEPAQMSAPPSATQRSKIGDDDDFDDFISATPAPSTTTAATSLSGIAPPGPTTNSVSATTQFAAPKPVSATQLPSLSGLTNISSVSSTPSQQPIPPMNSLVSSPGSTFASPPPLKQPNQPTFTSSAPATTSTATLQPLKSTGYQAATPNYFTSVQAQSSASAAQKPGLASTPSFGSAKPAAAAPSSAAKGKSGEDAFSNLWASATAGSGIKKAAPSQGPSLGSMAKQKSSAGIWGPAAGAATQQQQQRPMGAGMGMTQQQRPQAPPSQPQQQGGGRIGGSLDDLLG